MADLVSFGPFFLKESAETPGLLGAGTAQEVVDCAVPILGSSSTNLKTLAFEGLKRGIHDINLKGKFKFGSVTQADVAIATGTDTYALPADFYGMRAVQLINAAGNVEYTLPYMPWDQWNRVDSIQDETGRPSVWMMKDAFNDVTVQLYPVPDSVAASDWTLRLTTVKRINLPDTLNDQIFAPLGLFHVLCLYVEWFLLERKERNNPSAIFSKKKQYENALRSFKASEFPHTENVAYMSIRGMSSFANRDPGKIYI